MDEKIIIVKVKEICGEHCVGIEDGEALYKNISEILKSGNKAKLDFVNVLTITSSFLNAAIGRLFGQFKEDKIEADIFFDNLDENDKQLIQLVIVNAKEHFNKNKNEKDAENKIVENSIEEHKND